MEKRSEPRAKENLEGPSGTDHFNAVVDLAARRGFFHPSAQIYGGLAGFYDYGPAGAVMRRKMEAAWVEYWTRKEEFFLIDTPTIGPEQVFRASGHLDKFTDPVLQCKKCKNAIRADEFERMLTKLRDAVRPNDPSFRPGSRFYHSATQVLMPMAAKGKGKAQFDLEKIADSSPPKGIELDEWRELHRAMVDLEAFFLKLFLLTKEPQFICENGGYHDYGDVRELNLMFVLQVGATSTSTAYLRPETAQGIFWNFATLLRHHRGRLPLGVAQIGIGYRNEISPRNALIRMREFHMGEVEVFVMPKEKTWARFGEVQALETTFVSRDGAIHLETFGEMVKQGMIASAVVAHFMAAAFEIVTGWGMPEEKMRFRQHMPDEMAHYAEDCWDLEIETSLGWIECVGVADRGSYDLTRHQEYSGADLSVFVAYPEPKDVERELIVPDFKAMGPKFRGDAAVVGEAMKSASPQQVGNDGKLRLRVNNKDLEIEANLFKVEKRRQKVAGENFIPHVVEPSFGFDRLFFALLDSAYRRVVKEAEPYTILALDPRVAPVTVSVFPLMAKDGLDDIATRIHHDLVLGGIDSAYDDGGSIGKRYARADEVGTPWCITVDYESKDDRAVTLRHRDTQVQERIPIVQVAARVRQLLARLPGGLA